MPRNTTRFHGRGHVGTAPETTMFQTRTGKDWPLARIRIAFPDDYKNREGEWVNRAVWLTAEAQGVVAEAAAAKLNVGDYIHVEGSLTVWIGKDGSQNLKLAVERFEVLRESANGRSGGDTKVRRRQPDVNTPPPDVYEDDPGMFGSDDDFAF